MPRLEQRRAIGVNGPALFRPDYVLRDPLPGDTNGIGKGITADPIGASSASCVIASATRAAAATYVK